MNPTIQIETDLSPLMALPEALREHHYTESAVAELLGLWDISELSGPAYPLYCWRCRPNFSALSSLVQVFLLGLPTTRERLRELLGRTVVAKLLELGLLEDEGGLLCSNCVIYPCLGRYIVTDHWVSLGTQTEGKVYELGTDSYVLARVTPRRQGRALDLCTGSGVHAVHSASSYSPTWAVDINPRALVFTKLNAAIQGVELEVVEGDLYQPVKGETFDLVTANPPFVPSPDPEVLIHRSAGTTGEEVPERLVAGLKESLNRGGLFSMVLEHPVYAQETYLDRLERWLGSTHGWGIAVLTFREYAIGSYILRHLGGVRDPEASYNAYLTSYADVGIEAMRFANVFITRLPYSAPNWKTELTAPWPNFDISDQVGEWLESLVHYNNPEWSPAENWVPALNGRFTDLLVSHNSSTGILQKDHFTWLEPPLLSPEETELLKLILETGESVAGLRERWPHNSCRFNHALRGLGLARAVGVG